MIYKWKTSKIQLLKVSSKWNNFQASYLERKMAETAKSKKKSIFEIERK